MRKNYVFSIEELKFFKDKHIKLTVSRDVNLIGVPIETIDQMEVKRKYWVYRQILLWSLTIDPHF